MFPKISKDGFRRLSQEDNAEIVYYKWFDGVQVDIFDLGKVSKDIENLISSGADLEEEMPKLVRKYRQN